MACWDLRVCGDRLMRDNEHAHVVNGIDPVKGCELCDLLQKSAEHFANAEPSGREPPWIVKPDDL